MDSVLSPTKFGILWDRLISIADEILNTLVRTAFSIVVREGRDACCVILDKEGRSVAQSSESTGAFIATMPITAKHMLRKFPAATLNQGDILVTNDPWIGPGHLNDITIIKPVFNKGELVALIGTTTHLPDIGGIGYSATSSEIYEEGLRIPICKLVTSGAINEELLEIIQNNVRSKEQVIGDLKAAVAALHIGEGRIIKVITEYRIKDPGLLFSSILDRSEQIVRSKIEDIPNGDYHNTVNIEASGNPIKIECILKVRDGEILIDYSGTSSTISEALNSPLSFTYGWSAYGIKCAVAPAVPNNEGSFLPVKIHAPEGCILNAPHPCSVAARHIVGHFLPSVIFGALSKEIPLALMADAGLFSVIYFSGRDPNDSVYAIEYDPNGGLGATANYDGVSCTSFPTVAHTTPAEIFERATGLLLERRELRQDSGGPGKNRGGLGQIVSIRNTTKKDVTAVVTISRTEFPPRGFQGGNDGELKAVYINDSPAHPRANHKLRPGDTIRLEDAGGGGFYDPFQRDTDKVIQDVINGFVSIKSAKRDYGISIDPKTMKIEKH